MARKIQVRRKKKDLALEFLVVSMRTVHGSRLIVNRTIDGTVINDGTVVSPPLELFTHQVLAGFLLIHWDGHCGGHQDQQSSQNLNDNLLH